MATYEIRTCGEPGPVTVPARWSQESVATETVLILTVGDAPGLERTLGHLADLGVELQSVRRAPGRRPARIGTRGTSGHGPGTTYEVRVLGQMGPVLLHAVPHECSSSDARHRTVVAQTPDDVGLVDVLAALVATGARLERLRLRTGVRAVPPWRPAP